MNTHSLLKGETTMIIQPPQNPLRILIDLLLGNDGKIR